MYLSLGLSYATYFIHHHVQEGHMLSTALNIISLLHVCDVISVQCLKFFQIIETKIKYRHRKHILG